MDTTIYYTTPSVIIGQYEWIFEIYEEPYFGKRSRHRWRRVGHRHWCLDEEWPTYDSNNGATGGLPKSLARHYARHRAAIEKTWGETPAQSELFD